MEYILLFLEGVITFISPCILPMIPLYISYFSGGLEDDKKGNTMLNVIGFVIGFSIVFTLIGTMAGTLGALIQEHQKCVQLICGTIVTIFGLNYIGILNIRFLARSYKVDVEIKTFRFLSSALFGIIFALGWTPCVGTFLGAALMIAVQAGSSLKGAVMLLIYSAGLGLPFIVCGIFIDSLKETFSFLKEHYSIINKICGCILIVIGISMMTGTFQKLLSILAR